MNNNHIPEDDGISPWPWRWVPGQIIPSHLSGDIKSYCLVDANGEEILDDGSVGEYEPWILPTSPNGVIFEFAVQMYHTLKRVAANDPQALDRATELVAKIKERIKP